MIGSTGKVLLPVLALALAGCSSMLGGELVKQGEPVGAITIVNRAGIEPNVITSQSLIHNYSA